MTEPTSAKDQLAFVLIPGSFCPSSVYDNVSRKLTQVGYKNVEACGHLSTCKPGEYRTPPATLQDDALHIREVIQGFLAKGKDVVVVMNAYGGFPGTEAIKDLPSRSNIDTTQVEGDSGAVVGMVYLHAFLPHAGDSIRSLLGEALFEPLKSGTPGGYMVMPAAAGPGIFNDWYAEGKDKQAEAAAAELIPHSSDSFDGTISFDLWPSDVFQGKILYVIGEVDMIIPAQFAQTMIQKVNTMVPGRIQTVQIDKGGHATHITKPEIVAGLLEDLVAELQGTSS